MARVKRGTIKNKRRKNILAQTKGYRFDRKSKERVAHEAIRHAGAHAYAHRKQKKQEFRGLWNIRVNAAVRALGTTFSKFMGTLKQNNITLDRKTLADLAMNHSEVFTRVVNSVK